MLIIKVTASMMSSRERLEIDKKPTPKKLSTFRDQLERDELGNKRNSQRIRGEIFSSIT